MFLIQNLNKSKWSIEEEKILFELYLKFGSKWAKLKKFFEGRTENQLKNRFYSTLRKARHTMEPDSKNKVKNNELLRYIPNVVSELKADVKNLPSDLSIESEVILFMRQEDDSNSQEENKIEPQEESKGHDTITINNLGFKNSD